MRASQHSARSWTHDGSGRPLGRGHAPAKPAPAEHRSGCACGGGCPRCQRAAVQAKLAVTAPGDRQEQEAERAAEQVMRLSDPVTPGEAPRVASVGPPALSLVPCAGCEGSGQETEVPPSVSEVLSAQGQAMDPSTRAFMEPRFSRDFSHVRVHTGTKAAQSAREVNALAYTVGRNVVFGPGRYAPGTAAGRRLLAHELAHVVQQGGRAAQLARTAGPGSFHCPANTNGAPDSPFGVIDAVDRHAQVLAGASADLAIIATVLDPSTGLGGVDAAYRARFGTPVVHGTQFRNRFSGADLPTRAEAAQEEMAVIGDRLDRIGTFIGGPIHYFCHRQGVQFQHSNCVSTCRATDVAFSCAPLDLRRIEICPHFWALTDAEQAIAIIHEAGHMLFDFMHHGSGSRAARGANPECYASFVADIFGITPFDGRCPPLP